MDALKGDFHDADFLNLVRCGALCDNADFVDGAIYPTANGPRRPWSSSTA